MSVNAHRVSVTLPPDVLGAVDSLAGLLGVTRSAVVSALCHRALRLAAVAPDVHLEPGDRLVLTKRGLMSQANASMLDVPLRNTSATADALRLCLADIEAHADHLDQPGLFDAR